MKPDEYLEFIEDHGCIFHRWRRMAGGGHHFPQTRKRTDADWKRIPLCYVCHAQFHHDAKQFMNNKGGYILRYFIKQLPKTANAEEISKMAVEQFDKDFEEFWTYRNNIFNEFWKEIVQDE